MLSALLGRFGGYLAAFGAFAVAAGVIVLKAVSVGRRQERAKQTEKALKDATEAGEIDEDVARLSDDELDRELRVPGRNK